MIGRFSNALLVTAPQESAYTTSRSPHFTSQVDSPREEFRKNDYDVSVGLELVLRNVNESPGTSSTNGQIKTIKKREEDQRWVYQKIYNVAMFIASGWNSNAASMSASRDAHHRFAPMKSQLKPGMEIDHEWSYEEWIIGFSRSLSDIFLPDCTLALPFNYRKHGVLTFSLQIRSSSGRPRFHTRISTYCLSRSKNS